MLFILPRNPKPVHYGADTLFGIKVYDRCEDIQSSFRQWKEMGIDTIFPYPEHDQNVELVKYAAEYGIKLFLTIPVFHNPEQLKKKPSLYAVQANGEKAKYDWLEFVCPSKQAYTTRRIAYIHEIIDRLNPDGISLDFIRFFVFWEMVYPESDPDTIPQACFDEDCILEFEHYSKVELPENIKTAQERSAWVLSNHPKEWTEWKCHVIAETMRQISKSVKERKPDIGINVHTVPWRSDDFNGALERVAGQDLEKMSVHTDFISPMCYSHMLKREPVWIHSVVQDISRKAEKKIIPCIQVGNMYLSDELTPDHFEQSLFQAAKKPSHGIVMWSWKALDKSSVKKEIVRKFVRNTLR